MENGKNGRPHAAERATGESPAETRPARTVLMVAAEFPPIKTIGRIRTTKFITHLEAHGWRAVVLTVAPNGTSAVADPSLEGEIPPGLEVHRAAYPDLEAEIGRLAKRALRRNGQAPTPAASAPASPESAPAAGKGRGLMDRAHGAVRHVVRNFLELPDSYSLWALNAAREAERICRSRRIDLIYTTLPPFSAAWVGYRLRRRGLPWIADYRDLWTGDVLREWLPAWRTRVERWLERRLLRRADAVVAVSEQKTAYLKRLHGRSDIRWATITNGYDPEEFAGLARRREADGTIRFVFTGRLFKNRCGYAFAEALGQLKQERPDLAAPVRVQFLGGVSPEIRGRFDEIIRRHGLEGQFEFPGDVPHAVAKRAQVDTDYLLLIVDTGATSDGVIPGKLFEYVAARRPIFALTDPGATATIIRDGRLGWVVDAEDVAGCKALLAEVLSRPVPERLDADEDYLRQFDRRELTGKLAALFDEVAAAGGGGRGAA